MCLLPRAALPLGDAARQAIAAEMNLSETAFLECSGDENSHGGGATAADDFARCARFRLRWFTPTTEVPLCGHATLAAAAALLQGKEVLALPGLCCFLAVLHRVALIRL